MINLSINSLLQNSCQLFQNIQNPVLCTWERVLHSLCSALNAGEEGEICRAEAHCGQRGVKGITELLSGLGWKGPQRLGSKPVSWAGLPTTASGTGCETRGLYSHVLLRVFGDPGMLRECETAQISLLILHVYFAYSSTISRM